MATTTNYSWTTPDNTAYVKDGASAIRTLGSSVDTTLFTALGGAYPGLRLIKKQTIGSAVSSVTVTGAFSATYENYKIIVSGGSGSAQAYSVLTLGSTNTGYYAGYLGFTYASTVSNAGVNNGTGFLYSVFTDGSNGMNASIELLSPFASKPTFMNSQCATNTQSISAQGLLTGSTSYTAFTLTPASGTLTGGTIYVYGYGAS
jgi:hypothetical protein